MGLKIVAMARGVRLTPTIGLAREAGPEKERTKNRGKRVIGYLYGDGQKIHVRDREGVTRRIKISIK